MNGVEELWSTGVLGGNHYSNTPALPIFLHDRGKDATSGSQERMKKKPAAS